MRGELERLITLHGPPGLIRCYNGPEFIAGVTRWFLATADITTRSIDPGSPWQNGYKVHPQCSTSFTLLHQDAGRATRTVQFHPIDLVNRVHGDSFNPHFSTLVFVSTN